MLKGPILKILTHRNFKFIDERGIELDIEYPELDIEYPNSDFGEEGETDMNNDGYDGDVNSIKHIYRDCTWHQNFITYEPQSKEYLGHAGSTFVGNEVPTFSNLF